MRMYLCIYLCMYIYTCVYVCIHMYIYTDTYIYLYICMHTCIHTYIHIVLTRQGLAEAKRRIVPPLPPLPPSEASSHECCRFFGGGGLRGPVAAYPAVYLAYALAYGQRMRLRMGLPGLRLCGWRALTYSVFFFCQRPPTLVQGALKDEGFLVLLGALTCGFFYF